MNPIQCTDAQLIEECIQGAPEAFGLLIERHQGSIRLAIEKRISNKDDIKDLVQDTILKIATALSEGRYQEKMMFKAWVNRVAENMAVDFLRKKKRTPQMVEFYDFNTMSVEEMDGKNVPSYVPQYNTYSPEQIIIQQEINAALRTWISHLSSEQKEVIMARYFGKMSYKVIATVTGVSVNTALGRARYALNHLKEFAACHPIQLCKVV